MSRTPSLLLLLLVGLFASAAPAGASSPPVVRPAAVEAARDTTVTLEGRGYGHGHGLSQYGAEGQARQGRSTAQILRFYYPGTAIARRGGVVRVLLTEVGDVLTVQAQPSLKVAAVGGRTTRLRGVDARAGWWRIVPDGRDSTVQRSRDGSTWRTWRTLAGDAQFSADQPMRIRTSAGKASYRGLLRSVHADATGETRDIVDHVPLEAYLRGVVPQEVPALWHPAAVRAQAVAARTYAVFERTENAGDTYDLCDTAACQVYGGAGAEHPASDAAVRATAGQVLVDDAQPIFAQFSASNGGWTRANPGFPYLVAKKDPYDTWSGNPYRSWTVTLDGAAIAAQFPAIGDFVSMSVSQRDGHGAWGGRATELTLVGTSSTITVDPDTFRTRFGLRETWFRIV